MKERSVFGFLYLVAVVGCLLVGRSQQVAASFTLWNQTDFDNCVLLTDSVGGTNYDYRLYWTIDPTNTTIHIGVAAKASAWLGVGISADGTMDSGGSGSDVWVGWIGGASPACASGCVVDYWATAHEQPAKDTTGNLNTTGSEFGTIDGYTYFTYQRLLNTGDSAQDRPITPDVDQYVIHAIGPGLPTSVTDFSSAGNDGEHIIGTNAATFMKFGEAQWTCDATPTSPNVSAVNFYENPAKTWRLNWTVIDNEIEFNISAHTTGWWALGINTEEIMVGADILWCSWQGTNGVVVDRRASAHDTPPPDSVQNVDLISYQSVDGWSTCQLRRALNTGDSAGDIAIDGRSMILLWAYGSVTSGKRSIAERDCPDFCQHASNTKGLASINFFSGTTSEVATTDDKRKSHGILMLFAWGLLAVAGSFVARYCKTPQGAWVLYGYVWVHLHGLLGVLTFVLNLIAFALIVSWVSDQSIDHFKGAHEIIGLIMFICAFFQPLIGVISELFLKKYRDPNWVAYVIGVTHAWFGKALVLLGLVEIYLGLALYCVPTYAMVTYGVSIACMIALFLPHELLRWFAPWGSWLGGPGFTYQRVDDGGDTEMKDFSPDNKIPWMNKRVPRQPPLVVKICLWILQLGLAVAIIGLWIATAVGIGKKDINDSTDSYDDTCVIGTKFQ